MVCEVKWALDVGILVPVQLGGDVGDWCDRMKRDGTYVDHTFMEMSARILDSDIIVVSLHGNASGPCHIIRAGLLDGTPGRARSGRNFPIFLGYFEDERHTAGHFQSLTPFRRSDILDMVKADGGFDVAEHLHLPSPPHVCEDEGDRTEMSFAPSVNSTQFQTPTPPSSGASPTTPSHLTPPPLSRADPLCLHQSQSLLASRLGSPPKRE